MRKVVVLSAFLDPYRSGAEACAEEVSLALQGAYDCTIITARLSRSLPKRDMLRDRVEVRRVGLGCRFDKWLYPFLAAFAVRKYQPEIVHAVLETFAGMALSLVRVTYPRAKRILTLQTTNRSLLKRHIVRSAHVVTAISTTLVHTAKPWRHDPIVHIANGVDLPSLNKALATTSKVSGRVLFVGRLEQMKGVDTLVSAFSRLEGDYTLHIVGSGSQRRQLEKLAQSLGIVDRVVFTGRLEHNALFAQFAEAEVFCGLSRSEALGNVFLEAQAARCAVIGTTVGGIPDIVQSGKTGILVQPDNVDEAALALKKLLEDTDLRQSLAESGSKNAQSHDWNQIAQKYKAVYESTER